MTTPSAATGLPPHEGLAARDVVRALTAAGVDAVFTVPGESFLPVLDALIDEPDVRTVTARHEGGAAFMAEGYAKVAGRPAACMATRAVGAANLAIGLHTAHQDSTPVIAVLGQVAGAAKHREAFQETSLEVFLGAITKWSIEPTRADQLGLLTHRAARVALEGRPGPVALSFQEDLLYEPAAGIELAPITPSALHPGRADVARVLDLVRRARRPLLLLGGDVVQRGVQDAFVQLAEREHVPVVALWRRPDCFPNAHALYLGHGGLSSPPAVRRTLLEADAVVVVGGRLDENTTYGYAFPAAGTHVAHVDSDAGRLEPRGEGVGIVAHADTFVAAALALPGPAESAAAEERRAWVDHRRAAWVAQSTPRPREVRPGCADQFAVAEAMRELLPADTIVVTDAGNFSGYGYRYLTFPENGSFVGPGSGAMGYAVPAAIGAKLAAPERPVVGIVGDGGFLMTGSELETAARENLPVTIVLFDNGQYGTIRMHQEKHFPGRHIATDLSTVDYVGYATALGCEATEVRATGDFGPALATALRSTRPHLVVVRTDPAQTAVGMFDAELAAQDT